MPDDKEAKSALQKLDDGWQRLESRLCAAVLVAEIASLTLWIALKGLSSDSSPTRTPRAWCSARCCPRPGWG